MSTFNRTKKSRIPNMGQLRRNVLKLTTKFNSQGFFHGEGKLERRKKAESPPNMLWDEIKHSYSLFLALSLRHCRLSGVHLTLVRDLTLTTIIRPFLKTNFWFFFTKAFSILFLIVFTKIISQFLNIQIATSLRITWFYFKFSFLGIFSVSYHITSCIGQ